MKICLALDYRLSDADTQGLLALDERAAIDRRVMDELRASGLDRRSAEAQQLAYQTRGELLKELRPLLCARLTVALIATAVRDRYGDRMDRKAQRAWARIQDVADQNAVIDVSLQDAMWLAGLFYDGVPLVETKAWDAYPPDSARWLDHLSNEMFRVASALTQERVDVVKV